MSSAKTHSCLARDVQLVAGNLTMGCECRILMFSQYLNASDALVAMRLAHTDVSNSKQVNTISSWPNTRTLEKTYVVDLLLESKLTFPWSLVPYSQYIH
jgi:hypothetical protein